MKVLVVDDENPIVEAVAYNLRKEGFQALTASDAEQCLDIARTERPDLIILDVMLPSASGPLPATPSTLSARCAWPIPFFGNDLVAQIDALVADRHAGTGNELLTCFWLFPQNEQASSALPRLRRRCFPGPM